MSLTEYREALATIPVSEFEQPVREASRKAEEEANKSVESKSTLETTASNSWWNIVPWSKGSNGAGNATSTSEPNTRE